MFSVPTVFIIGAGTGKDIGMPVGSALSDAIAHQLDFYFEQGQLVRGDELIVEVLRRLARERGANVNEWVMAGRSVAQGIRYTRSIDPYVNTHRDNEKIKECAKLAIARSILKSEHEFAIAIDPNTGRWKLERTVLESWLPVMMYLLQDKIVRAENFNDLFANFTVINFNYDRCIEHFLLYAICHLYGVDQRVAAEAMNTWNGILHPYGTVGALPWQDGKRKVPFGAEGYFADFFELSQEIFTYNEKLEDAGGGLKRIRDAIVNARRLIFLGFHFHQQNMDLLRPAGGGASAHVYATVWDRHGPEVEVIKSQLSTLLGGRQQYTSLAPLKCLDLLNHYGTTLLQ